MPATMHSVPASHTFAPALHVSPSFLVGSCFKMHAFVVPVLHSMPAGHSALFVHASEQYLPLCCGSPTQRRSSHSVPLVHVSPMSAQSGSCAGQLAAQTLF